MGCDGGTIPRRDELVRVKKKPEQKDKESELSFRWRHCAITQQPLQPPIVACGLGRLYCKESVLEGLLDRTKLPETATHITSLKDVRELVLTPNPSYARERTGDKGESGRYVDHRCAPYSCPTIGLELSGKFRFAFPWSCGCVVSEKALKEVPSKLCHKCQKPYDPEDLVFLNAEGEVLELMKTRLEARRALAKATKKNKRQRQTATVTSEQSASENTVTPPTSVPENQIEVKEGDITDQVVTVKVEKVEEMEEKVTQKRSHSPEIKPVKHQDRKDEVKKMEEVEFKEKQREERERKENKVRGEDGERKQERVKGEERKKMEERVRGEEKRRKEGRERREERSRRKSRERRSSKERRHRERKSGKLDSISDPAYKKAKSGYSVADDPSSTSVYKSLFTSHKDAKSQTKAHWVTYNPFYN